MFRRAKRTGDTAPPGANAAAQLKEYLDAGGELAPVPAPGLPLGPGETAYADVLCGTARRYATEVVYPPPAGYFEDHPSFGRRWVANPRLTARRNQAAEEVAQDRWRDQTSARVVLTSVGLRVLPTGTTAWLPFDHALLTGLMPSPEHQAVELSYSVCAPMMLTGTTVPWLTTAIKHLISKDVNEFTRNQPTRQINPQGAASCRITEAPHETSS
ncbi:hypothetical protein ACFYXL_14555 [Streptomyces tsukubensis]|uniref:hypothetical protein n=1 Tax=Streptomyces tsukubensis TaxID=83656 RepID=UPI0036AE1A3E